MGRFAAACPIAFAATAGFAVFEGMLDRLLESVDPATLFALRALVTLPLMLVVLHLFGRAMLPELRRIACRPSHWVRGLCWSATACLMILSFWHTESLTQTYALMLLHPLWTVVLTPLALGERQDWRPYRGCFALLLGGLALYGFGDGVDPQSPASYLTPIAAGAAFALTNLVGVRIKRELGHDALTKAVGSTAVALLLAPLILWIAPQSGGVEPTGAAPLERADLLFLAGLVALASCVALAANVGMSFAFDTARNSAVIAAIDTTIIAFGVALDALFNPAFDLGACFGVQGVGMAAMTVGAVWAAVKLERAGLPGARCAARAVTARAPRRARARRDARVAGARGLPTPS